MISRSQLDQHNIFFFAVLPKLNKCNRSRSADVADYHTDMNIMNRRIPNKIIRKTEFKCTKVY